MVKIFIWLWNLLIEWIRRNNKDYSTKNPRAANIWSHWMKPFTWKSHHYFIVTVLGINVRMYMKTHHFVSLCCCGFSSFGSRTCACHQIDIVNIVHPSQACEAVSWKVINNLNIVHLWYDILPYWMFSLNHDDDVGWRFGCRLRWWLVESSEAGQNGVTMGGMVVVLSMGVVTSVTS